MFLGAVHALDRQVRFIGKHSLFKWPMGGFMRALGGVPVDRHNPRGAVGAMVSRFALAREHDEFLWLALSPEGTRGYRDSWRSGFYQVALQAGVPLGLAFFDYPERCVGVDSFVCLTGDVARNMAAIEARLGQRLGRKPELAAPVRLSRP